MPKFLDYIALFFKYGTNLRFSAVYIVAAEISNGSTFATIGLASALNFEKHGTRGNSPAPGNLLAFSPVIYDDMTH